MKIPNTVCSGCNQLLDLLYHHREEFGIVSEGYCYNCKKDYPKKTCNVCKQATIHIGFSYGACTNCILTTGFNLEQEFIKALRLLHNILVAIDCEVEVTGDTIGLYREGSAYLETLERQGYDKKYYIDDNNSNLPDSNQGITP